MEYIEIITLAFVGIGAIVLQWKKELRFIAFLNLLLTSVVVLWLKQFVADEDLNQLYGLLALVGLNYVLAQIPVLQKVGWRVLFPIASFFVYFLIFKSDSITVLGDEYSAVNKFVITGTILSIVGFEFGLLKTSLIQKLFKGVQEIDITKSVLLFLMALAIFFGGFGAGSFGLLVIASAFISASHYRKDESTGYGVSFLALSLFAGLLTLTGETEVNLLGADVLEGIFIGLFGSYLIHQIWNATNRMLLVIGYALFLALSAIFLFLLTVYGQMGGMDAFIGMLLGAAIVNMLHNKGYVGQSIFALMLVVGMLLPAFMKNEALENFETEIGAKSVSEENAVHEELPSILDLKELVGSYKLDPSNSNVQFNLGKKGETKGAFKNVTGTVLLMEDITKSKFDIKLDMKDFTTFNAFRDESLRGDDYFKADKFPTMTYRSKSISDKGNDEYEIEGEFTMLGVTKNINVSLFRIEKDGKKVISGTGEIDRREFGMTPSATEGNIVSFEYEVQLIIE